MALTPTFSIDNKEFRTYGSPGAYVAWESDDQCLYVGCSKNVMGRVCHSAHHKRSVLKRARRIDVYVCGSWADALQLEKVLIKELRPSRNGFARARSPWGNGSEQAVRERWQAGPLNKREFAIAAWQQGISRRRIGQVLGVSRQRVSQLIGIEPRLPAPAARHGFKPRPRLIPGKLEPNPRWKYSRARIPHVDL